MKPQSPKTIIGLPEYMPFDKYVRRYRGYRISELPTRYVNALLLDPALKPSLRAALRYVQLSRQMAQDQHGYRRGR